MSEFERGREALRQLCATLESDVAAGLNEATTRHRFVNALLSDVLAWPPEVITCEEHEQGDYLDYVLGSPQRYVVVEAKRAGQHFEVPSGVAGSRTLTLKTLYDYSAANAAAVDQVLRYCHKGGVPVAALCNGHQIVAFLGSRQDGVSPLKGRCVLFSSLNEMLDDFSSLWDYLSQDGVRAGNLKRHLGRGIQSTPPPERLSARLVDYPGARIRNTRETDLGILSDLFLQDLIKADQVSKAFLRECYCVTGALSQYSLASREVLKTRYAGLAIGAEVASVEQRDGKSSRLGADVVTAALSSKPLILLGDVGVGKSIFLKHFLAVDAADLLAETRIFYVDFLKQSSLLKDVGDYVLDVVVGLLLNEYGVDIDEGGFVRAVYNAEINRFKRSLHGELQETDPTEFAREQRRMLGVHVSNRAEHVRRSLEHLRGSRGWDFLLVLDNIDHHEPELQDKVFLIGQSLAGAWPAAVFLSLRPDTFYASRRSGSLAAFQPRVFTVSPPRVELVIQKRVTFARGQLQTSGRLDTFPSGLTIDSVSLDTYLGVLENAFHGNNDLIELVVNLSGGNVRQALDFVSTFTGSPYTSFERILDAEAKRRGYAIPVHEFLRAILLKDGLHYDPRSSDVVNVFDITVNDGREHFLLPILLAACESSGEARHENFVDASWLFEHCQELNYGVEQIEAQIARGIHRKLFDQRGDGRTNKSLRVTTSGSYMYKRLMGLFTYVDTVIVDTPIVDPRIRAEIIDVDTKPIQERIDRARIFASYLDDRWDIGEAATTFSWPMVTTQLAKDINAVEERSSRANVEHEAPRLDVVAYAP